LALSYAELQRGPYKNSGKTALRQARLSVPLRSIPVLPFDAAAAAAYGAIIAQCGWVKGRDYDRMIAGHAVSTGSILVTANIADFGTFPDWRSKTGHDRLKAAGPTIPQIPATMSARRSISS
jgi:tRNA(fMet)-specific endonuclease VapC